MGLSILGVKLICIVILGVLPFICTLLPLKVFRFFEKRGKYGEELMGWLMCFGGGVFFATYIMHMNTEVRDILTPVLLEPHNITYPLPELLMAIGFFIVMFIEIVAMDWGKKQAQKQKDKKSDGDNRTTGAAVSNGVNNAGYEANAVTGTGDVGEGLVGHIHNTAVASVSDEDRKGDSSESKRDSSHQNHLHDQHDHHHHGVVIDASEDEELRKQHQRQTMILTVALSVHRVFEGLAIGLAMSKQAVWRLTLAVVLHETVISFGLGLQFVRNGFSAKKLVIFAAVCSVFEPFGAAVGTILSEAGGDNDSIEIFNGIIQAISTGTFIYVTFFEILAEEIGHHKASKTRFLFLVVGFAVMAGLNAIPENSDDEDEAQETMHM